MPQKFLIIFSIIPFLACGQAKKKGNRDIIIWSADYKLQWSDYRTKDSSDYYHHKSGAAETTYRIDFGDKNGKNDTLIVRILTIFLKKESFYDPKFINSGDTIFSRKALKHERIHFDIGEIYARKLRKDVFERIDKFKHKRSDQVLSIITKLYYKEDNECRVQQALFDKEVNVGDAEIEAMKKNIVFSKEDRIKIEGNLKIWREKVDKELQELERYSETTITIKVRKLI
jgi:hypothetical protein